MQDGCNVFIIQRHPCLVESLVQGYVTEHLADAAAADGSSLRLTEPTGVIAANNMSNYLQLLDIVANRHVH